MKKFEFLKGGGLVMLLVMLLCAAFGVVDGSVLAADATVIAGGGVAIKGEPVTTQVVRANSDDILLNDIERKVVKIRPMGNPLEQLSRYASRRSSKSQIHEYYSTDTLPSSAKMSGVYTEESVTGAPQATINTTNNSIFSVYETLILPTVKGWNEDGTAQTDEFLQLYIVDKAADGKLIVKPVNGKAIGATENSLPTIPDQSLIIRAGRAHNETDMRTTTYASVPTKKKQYLQIFRAQIEESTLAKMADKEADWTFSDLEEEAIFDMKRGMNKTFWLGTKKIIYDAKKKEVYMTQGIWWQAGKTFLYGKSAQDTQFDNAMLVELCKMAFTGNAGNREKIFIVGSGLMANLSKMSIDKTMNDEKTMTRWGIKFKVIETNFGTLHLVHDESLDEMGFTNNGLIFDPNYMRKISIHELKTYDLDLRKSGESDVDARTISEISGLILQNPDAHVKVMPVVA